MSIVTRIRGIPQLRPLGLWLGLVAVPFAVVAIASTLLLTREDDRVARPLFTHAAPHGEWVGRFGSKGYALLGWNGARDRVSLPAGATLTVVADRFAWPTTSDRRALESPNQKLRKASIVFGAIEIHLELRFARSFNGVLRLYALDWDTTERRQTITIDDGSRAGVADLDGDFSRGVWIAAPLAVAAGGTVVVSGRRTAGASVVLSGIFLD